MKTIITITKDQLREQVDLAHYDAFVFKNTKYSDLDILSMIPTIVKIMRESKMLKAESFENIYRVGNGIYMVAKIGDMNIPRWFMMLEVFGRLQLSGLYSTLYNEMKK